MPAAPHSPALNAPPSNTPAPKAPAQTGDKGRAAIVKAAGDWVKGGGFFTDLARRIAIRSESPREDSAPDHLAYLTDELQPMLKAMGFDCRLLDNPSLARLPVLFAQRIESPSLPTILLYGHGDVLWGMEGEWSPGLSPFTAVIKDGRIYGRGAVDNKGQHTINLKALEILLSAQGHLGFNVKILLEMGEEAGSPGLAIIAADNKDLLCADVLIASDGPRISARQPTVFLGARGAFDFTLSCQLRPKAYHSGNWGGLLPNAGIRLAHALATITDPKGRILIPDWLPGAILPNVQAALDSIVPEYDPEDPQIDDSWGEPGLSGPAQALGWCNFEVLAFHCGRPEAPVGAIPGGATAACQLRFVAGVNSNQIIPALRQHLDIKGFSDIIIHWIPGEEFKATRTDPGNPWTELAVKSITQTTGRSPALAPNFGGALPNEIFADILGLPTLWIPHSHPACGQHAPDEHMIMDLACEGAEIMAGLFWDLGHTNGVARQAPTRPNPRAQQSPEPKA